MLILDSPCHSGEPIVKGKLSAEDALVNLAILTYFLIFVPICLVIFGALGVVVGFFHQDWGAIFLSLWTIVVAVVVWASGLIFWLHLMVQPGTFGYQLIWLTLGLAVAAISSILGLCVLALAGVFGGGSTTIFVRIL